MPVRLLRITCTLSAAGTGKKLKIQRAWTVRRPKPTLAKPTVACRQAH